MWLSAIDASAYVDVSCRCTFFAFIRTFSFLSLLLLKFTCSRSHLSRAVFFPTLFLPSGSLVRIAPFQLINELLISIEIHKRTQVEMKAGTNEKENNNNRRTPDDKSMICIVFVRSTQYNTQDALLIISMAMDNILNCNRNELTIENSCQATSLTTITHLIKHHHQNGFSSSVCNFSLVSIHSQSLFVSLLPHPHSLTRAHLAWASVRSYGCLFLFMFSVSIM